MHLHQSPSTLVYSCVRDRSAASSFLWAWGVALVLGATTACRESGGTNANNGDTPGDGDPALEDADAADPDDTPDGTDVDKAPPFAAIDCAEPKATPQKLHEKAARFDELALTLHMPAGQDLWYSAFVKEDLVTWDRIDMSDNVGSWTAMYAASQAFRFAATKDPQARANLKRSLGGMRDMMKITGVEGLFSRTFVDPTLPGFPSAEQLLASYPNCDLSKAHCKRYNEVKEGPFKGKWFKNDVSKDEYAAHMFTVGVVWDIVDDAEIRDIAAEIALAVGRHLMRNRLAIIDIDGKPTLFGYLRAMALDDFPGFNALLALSWTGIAAKIAREVGDPDAAALTDFYENCLLQKAGERACIPDEDPKPYTAWLNQVGLNLNCKTNWNNHNMTQLALFALLRHETDPEVRAKLQTALRDQLWAANDPRPMKNQESTLYSFFYIIHRAPEDPYPEAEACAAMRVMKRFPASKEHRAVDTARRFAHVCTERKGDPMSAPDQLVPLEEDGMDNFLWSRNPYELQDTPANPRLVESPEDYLLAYWLGRYFGFISPEM